MLRRKPTAITLTPEDVSSYEDRQATIAAAVARQALAEEAQRKAYAQAQPGVIVPPSSRQPGPVNPGQPGLVNPGNGRNGPDMEMEIDQQMRDPADDVDEEEEDAFEDTDDDEDDGEGDMRIRMRMGMEAEAGRSLVLLLQELPLELGHAPGLYEEGRLPPQLPLRMLVQLPQQQPQLQPADEEQDQQQRNQEVLLLQQMLEQQEVQEEQQRQQQAVFKHEEQLPFLLLLQPLQINLIYRRLMLQLRKGQKGLKEQREWKELRERLDLDRNGLELGVGMLILVVAIPHPGRGQQGREQQGEGGIELEWEDDEWHINI
ncbi:MAG: hypothetical protein M1823_002002 [Watsoniomyces obsoletus]|nr:MAG: hypothetical protein M1823_002002 [Watsoniomyces obsoletus]